jgi:hypothetical protein
MYYLMTSVHRAVPPEKKPCNDNRYFYPIKNYFQLKSRLYFNFSKVQIACQNIDSLKEDCQFRLPPPDTLTLSDQQIELLIIQVRNQVRQAAGRWINSHFSGNTISPCFFCLPRNGDSELSLHKARLKYAKKMVQWALRRVGQLQKKTSVSF